MTGSRYIPARVGTVKAEKLPVIYLGAIIPVAALAEISIDGLGVVIWILAIVVGVSICRWHLRKIHWAVLGAVATFIAANVAFGIYVVAHPTDPRWSPGAPLPAPVLSDTPMIGQHLEEFDSHLASVMAGINIVRDYHEAIPVALNFFTVAGWGCLAAIPVALVARYVEKKWQKVEKKRQKAEIERYGRVIEDLLQELDDVKRFVNYQG